MRVKMSSDFEQRRQSMVTGGEVMMPVAEVLHRARPINACHQAGIAETRALDHLWRTEKENFIERALRTQLVDALNHKRTGSQRDDQASARDHRSFPASRHFKSRCSKISTAPLSAIVAYNKAYRVFCRMSCPATGCSCAIEVITLNA